MPYQITRQPPEPGAHSLGQEVLMFNDQGVAYTDNPEVATAAADFPLTFTVEEVAHMPAADPPPLTVQPHTPAEEAEALEAITAAVHGRQADPSLDPDAILRDVPPPAMPPSQPERRRR